MPLGAEERDDTVTEESVEGQREQMPFVGGHAARLSSKAEAGLQPRSEEQGPGHRKSEPRDPHNEEQMVAVWAGSDEMPHSEVLPPGEDSETP